MSGIKIHNYPLERFTFGDDDFYDIDYWDGAQYQTAKIKGSTIKAGIQSAVNNIYNNDGDLAGNRIVSGGASVSELTFDAVGKFHVKSNEADKENVIFDIKSQDGYNSFVIRDQDTGNEIFACINGIIKICDAWFLPSVDGTAGQVLTTTGTGDAQWVTPSTITNTNIYTDNGTLANNRTLDGNAHNYRLTLEQLKQFIVKAETNETGRSIDFYTLENSAREGFCISDEEETVIFSTLDGHTRIHDAFQFPKVNGTNGQLLKTTATGQLEWIAQKDLTQKDQIHVACSDETTVLSVANGVLTFRSPFTCNIQEIRASLTTAGSGGGVTEVDILLNGASIFTTAKLTIDSGSKTRVGASTPYASNILGFSDDDEIRIDITDITNEPTETGLKVLIKVTRN